MQYLYIISTIIVGAVVLLCLFQNRIYRVPTWKLLIAALVIVGAGLLGISLLYYIEYGVWGGKSFFGCIFVTPIALWAVSKIIHVQTEVLMDMAGPICAAFLALIKSNCLYYGCCEGVVLRTLENGTMIRFPSQIVEGLNGIVICIVLLLMQRNSKNRGCLAPALLMLFGATRFVLNTFRDNLWSLGIFHRMGLFVPRGHLWAAICIFWGIIWMYRARSRVYGRKLSAKEFIKSIFGLLPLKECA